MGASVAFSGRLLLEEPPALVFKFSLRCCLMQQMDGPQLSKWEPSETAGEFLEQSVSELMYLHSALRAVMKKTGGPIFSEWGPHMPLAGDAQNGPSEVIPMAAAVAAHACGVLQPERRARKPVRH